LKWFADERKDPMSFIFICEYLDIDAKALRRKIARGFKNKCMRDTKQIMGGRVGTYNRKKEKQENDK
jgi:hypothetical protein